MARAWTWCAAALLAAVLCPWTWGQSGTVEVALEQFGVGSNYRPGDFTAIRLGVRSELPEVTRIWIQVEVPNADGDIGEYGRSLTLSPGQQLPVWLYVPLPPDIDSRLVLPVRVFEERDGRRRRELGGARISPSDVSAAMVDIHTSLLAVVGPSQVRMQLNQYTNPKGTTDRPDFAHESTRVVFGLQIDMLPDRWEGWRGFEAVAWGEAAPREMTAAQADALREYVRRGGHLVISLPDAGNPWGLGAEGQTQFDDLMPTAAPRKDVAVPLSSLLPVLSKTRTIPRDLPLTAHVFKQLDGSFDAIDNHYRPLVALADGRVIAVQRSYGFGQITLLGLDLSDRQLLSVPRAVQADVLWNRVLGRRTDTPTGNELADLDTAGRNITSGVQESDLGGSALVTQLISMSEEAGLGLFTVLLVIVAYWVAAGPGGFFALRQYRLHQHSWLAFAAAAGVFTAAAWGLVSVIKPSTYKVRHLTYLDMLARPGGDRGEQDPQLYRATSWLSLNMPGYRRTAVFVESLDDHRDLLVSWAPPGLDSQPFPNPDRYRVDVGGPPADFDHFLSESDGQPEFKRPSRSTATHLYASWLGGLDGDWGGPIRSDPANPVSVRLDAGGNERLVGSIVHDLPGDLTNVTITWVDNRRTPPRRYAASGDVELPWVPRLESGAMLNRGGMWKIGAWPAGEWLVLEERITSGSVLQSEIEDEFVKPYARPGSFIPTGSGPIREQDRNNYLMMLGIFNQLQPPTYMSDEQGKRSAETVAFNRFLGRELDLSAWFNGPCLIVTAHLKGAACPIPLVVNGEPAENDEDSLTIVRWIHPLPLYERIAFKEAFESGGGGSAP